MSGTSSPVTLVNLGGRIDKLSRKVWEIRTFGIVLASAVALVAAIIGWKAWDISGELTAVKKEAEALTERLKKLDEELAQKANAAVAEAIRRQLGGRFSEIDRRLSDGENRLNSLEAKFFVHQSERKSLAGQEEYHFRPPCPDGTETIAFLVSGPMNGLNPNFDIITYLLNGSGRGVRMKNLAGLNRAPTEFSARPLCYRR